MTRLRLQSILLPIVVWACSSALIFRRSLRTGFDILPGDELDSRLILRIQEHWFRFFSGKADWLDLGMFYPTPNSLGFSDTFFLYGLTHSLFRSLGLDIFHAGIANLFLLSAIGFFGMYLLCRTTFKFTPSLSLFLATMLICFSPVNMTMKYMHTQIFSIWYIPWVAILGYKFFETLDAPLKRNARWAIAFAASFALSLYNAVYIPWFLSIYLLAVISIGLLGFLVTNKRNEKTTLPTTFWKRLTGNLQACSRYILQRWGKFGILAVSFSLSLFPFFLTYLPILKISKGHDFSAALRSLPYPIDLINTTPWSLVWGWLAPVPHIQNHGFGLPLISFILSSVTLAYALFFYRSKESGVKSQLFVRALAGGVLICWILMIQVDGRSLWIIPYELIPGASAIRVIYRFNVLLCLPILLIWGIGSEQVWSRINTKPISSLRAITTYAAIALLGGFLVFEQTIVDTRPDNYDWNLKRSKIQERLAEIPPPPDEASIFFVTPYKEEGNRNDLRSQLEAWAIAQDYDLKTMNGYSGILPKYFRLFGVPGSKYPHEYDFVVRSWINIHEITSPIYNLDLNTRQWNLYDPSGREEDLPVYPLGSPLVFKRGEQKENPYKLAQSLSFGWSGPEPSHTWTDGYKAELALRLDKPAYSDLQLSINCFAFVHGKHPKQDFQISVNGDAIGALSPKGFSSAEWYHFTIPQVLLENTTFLRIRIDCPDAMAPASVYNSSDQRTLGLGVIEMKLENL